MTARAEKSNWRVIGESRRGVSHVRLGLRNQDALEYWTSAQNDIAIAAVADGHGSEMFLRSDVGARLAVKVGVQILRRFAEQADARIRTTPVAQVAQQEIPQQLTREWREVVLAHLQSTPITEEEWARLSSIGGKNARTRLERNPTVVYGSTILAVLVTATYVVYVQLGDGDILIVDQTGNTRRAIAKDERLLANQTSSLCQDGAASEVRIQVDENMNDLPALILLSTDGYSNSFVTEDDFLRIGRDYLAIIRTDGMETAERELGRFLDETSAEGSGDDITLGLIWRMDDELATHLTEAEEEVPVAVAAKLTADIDDARKRIDELNSAVAALSTRVRWLQIALAAALIIAVAGFVLALLPNDGISWNMRGRVIANEDVAADRSDDSPPILQPAVHNK